MKPLTIAGLVALGLTGLYVWLKPGGRTVGQLQVGDRFSASTLVTALNAQRQATDRSPPLPVDVCFRVAQLVSPAGSGGPPPVHPARGTLLLAAVLDDDRAGTSNGKGPFPFYSRDAVGPCAQPAPAPRRLPTPAPPAPPPVRPIGVVQPMPQTRVDLGSSFPMVTGRNYKIFERSTQGVDPASLPPFAYPGMRVTAVFLDPVGGVRETSVTYTGPSDNVAFGPPQATGVFVGVQDDVVAV